MINFGDCGFVRSHWTLLTTEREKKSPAGVLNFPNVHSAIFFIIVVVLERCFLEDV
ncbi:hypothetical protein FB550_104298 [Neobacillus bataviensis]|uniref:Uncharacterized protein n=1 Tax=Neobacillus bataviensis TaxID=220685 RepID=A0A561DH89_9BACI|nr:hypothetical protein FB550_104298 [Neobacillus bataviensis]